MDGQQQKYVLLTTEPVEPLVIKLAIPSIISMLVTSFYNLTDTYFVGTLGTSATAAVGVTFAFMSAIQALGFFFGHGSGNFVSRKLGAKEYDEANTMASLGVFYAFFSGCLLCAVGLVFLEEIAVGLGSTKTILPYALSYLRVILLGAPFMISAFVMNNLLRFQGSAVYGMVGIVLGAVMNVILDPLFIFGFNMGIRGAALATILSQISSLLVLLFVSTKGGNIKISWRNFHPSLRLSKEIVLGGFPSLARQGISCVSTIALNVAAGVYGDAAIAAMSIVNRVSFFAISAMIGFGQGFQPVCGFNYGAGLYQRVKVAFWFCTRLTVVVLSILALIGGIFASELVALFRDDAEVIAIGAVALRYQCLLLPCLPMIIMSNMTLQTLRQTAPAVLVAVSRQGLFYIPILLILPPLMGLQGVQIAQSVADVFAFVLSAFFVMRFLKKMGKESQ